MRTKSRSSWLSGSGIYLIDSKQNSCGGDRSRYQSAKVVLRRFALKADSLEAVMVSLGIKTLMPQIFLNVQVELLALRSVP